MKAAVLALTAFFFVTAPAHAELTRVEIKTRTDVGDSGYEKIIGTAHFAVDPKDPHNRVIVDVDKAPRNAQGRVEFSADMYILRPKDATRGNGTALIDVLNRGGKPALSGFNRAGGNNDPVTPADLGDAFLMRHGFIVAWVGWEFDVTRSDGMKIHVPAATEGGAPIFGVVRGSATASTRSTELTISDLASYDPVDARAVDSQLTDRATLLAPPVTIPRDRWTLAGHTVTLDSGFEPGHTYELSFRATQPPVVALGFAAFRDFGAWMKFAPDAVASAKRTIAFGSSQSGRFLRDYLYEGFNTDEHDRQVFDGVMPHIAGAARIAFNERWSTPTTLGVYSATAFPFSDAAQRDPVSGAQDGLLAHARARAHQPKIFYTNTPVEYWGTGRVAALIHATPDGAADITPPDNVRIYFLAGTQHAPSRFPPAIANGQQHDNPVDYWWTMRALLLAMNNWITDGTAPPPSAYPMLRDRSLVKATEIAFPAIPTVQSPKHVSGGTRVANPLIAGGAGAGAPLPLLVPQVDADGNEIAGIRLPDVAVPLATYTGWNFRNPKSGASTDLVSLLGSSIPFPATKAARESVHDPRVSIEERYTSRDEYLSKVRAAAADLVKKRYLLADDIDRILKRAADNWDYLHDQHTRSAQEPSGR
ncbi:MAG TPA: alpha/beta hydrolase domain-containing protein [Vicinamibacterales bacterium]|nr:alpha/beta hydrolase domain-containing protein [Vicinamibacterales bacterium]